MNFSNWGGLLCLPAVWNSLRGHSNLLFRAHLRCDSRRTLFRELSRNPSVITARKLSTLINREGTFSNKQGSPEYMHGDSPVRCSASQLTFHEASTGWRVAPTRAHCG